MKYNKDTFTNGVELELGDWDTTTQLPGGATWNRKDYTCMNTNGIANDPTGKLYKFGGEINTTPHSTVDGQINHIADILRYIPGVVTNYRCNMHIHYRVPGLRDDLETLKQVIQYVDKHQQRIFDIVEHIEKPIHTIDKSTEEFNAELKRYKRTIRSHQHKLSKNMMNNILDADSTKEFFDSHAPSTADGRVLQHLSIRAGINIKQLLDTDTIEFRHFPQTLDLFEIRSCLEWCGRVIDAAVNTPDKTPDDIFKEYYFMFPKFQPFNYAQDRVFLFTRHENKNHKKNMSLIRKEFDIDTSPKMNANYIYQYIKEFDCE